MNLKYIDNSYRYWINKNIHHYFFYKNDLSIGIKSNSVYGINFWCWKWRGVYKTIINQSRGITIRGVLR